MTRLVLMYRAEHAPWQVKFTVPENCTAEFFDPDCRYASNTVFYYDLYGPYHDNIPKQLANGHKVIFDAKNEHYVHVDKQWVYDVFSQYPGQGCFVISGQEAESISQIKIIATPYWYWIVDQVNLMNFKIHEQKRNWSITKKFFMALGLHRHERDYLWDSLGSLLDDSLHSCRYKGIFLPDDYVGNQSIGQRYINAAWLDATAFTLAVETYIDETRQTGYSLTRNNNLFLCEKTYKPLAAQHPLLMASTPGNLRYLRSQGFETYPELFDESYDDIENWQQRIDRLVEIVKNFDTRSVDQPVVKEKMRHNQAHFFDQELTRQHVQHTLLQPIAEFIHD